MREIRVIQVGKSNYARMSRNRFDSLREREGDHSSRNLLTTHRNEQDNVTAKSRVLSFPLI